MICACGCERLYQKDKKEDVTRVDSFPSDRTWGSTASVNQLIP